MPKDHPSPVTETETTFQKFQRLAQKIVSVPKTEIDRRESDWKQRQKDKKS